jgi:probable phosphoglycerate mutase
MNGNLFEGSSPAAETPAEWFTAHCDGGSRGNPGPSGYGAVVEDAQGRVVAELNEFLGLQTNNYAEYKGLLAVLTWAMEHDAKQLRVISDSELMVKQMKGQYKVASPMLRPLFEEARKMSRRLERFEIRHTLRGGNKEADRLANEAMDKGMRKVSMPRVGKPADFDAARQAARGSASNAPGATGAIRTAPSATVKTPHQILEGYVKNGVVHLLNGEIPDGVFVKVIRE